MNNNERFDRIKAKHPDWSDDQVWMAVSLDLQQDATIEQNKDVDPNDPNIWKDIVNKAKDWLQEVLPVVFEKVKEIFAELLNRLKEWIAESIPVVFERLTDLIGGYTRRG